MELTASERDALERLGPQAVAAKLAASPGLGRGAEVRGFTSGSIDRGKVEDWLGEQHRKQEARETRDSWWGRFGVWMTIATGLGGAVVGGLITWALSK